MRATTPPDASAEDLLLPISALQHYLFCPRQCALIHVERLWAENAATAEGRILHEKADSGKADRRGGVQTLRSVQLRSFALGIAGAADVVEKRGDVLTPVEYKRGKPKAHRADEVQLWTALRERLIGEIDTDFDSLRFYRLGAEGRKRIEHVGAKAALDLEGPLQF